MATVGNSTVADAACEGRGARAGGQFRKRHMRKTTAPYDRPTTAHGNQQRYGWLSKVVDPASKVITSAANRIFGSVFRKCHIPTTEQSPGQIMRDSRDNCPDQLPLTANYSTLCQQGNSREIRNLDTSFNGNRVAELKPMLKKKLTRSDGALGDKKAKCEVKAEGLGHENWAKQREFAIGARDLRDDDASRPAGLIKVHMSAKASPNLSLAPKAVLKHRISLLQSDIGTVGPVRRIRRKLNLLSYKNLALPAASPSLLMVQGAGTASADPHIRGTHPSISPKKSMENVQFNEPEKLAQPYSRQGDICELTDSSLGTLHDLSEPTRTASSACPPHKSQAFKRSSSELESDIAPIQRIRRKPTVLYSKNLGLPASGASSVSQGQSALSDGREEVASETPETLAPLEKKLHTVEGGQPIDMIPNLLPGWTLSGLEKVNSLDGSVGGQKCSNLSESTSHHAPSSNYNSRQDTGTDKAAEEELTSSSKSDAKHRDPTPSDKTVANEDLLPSDKTVPSMASIATLNAPKKGPAFQMSAHEDCLELDDDLQPNEIDTDFTFPILPPIPDFTFPIFPEVSNVPLLKESKVAGEVSPISDQNSCAGIAPSNVGSGILSKQQACNVSEPAVCTLFAPATQSMPSLLATSASIPTVGSSVSSIPISASSEFCSFAASCPVLVSSSSNTSLTSDSSCFVFGSFAASSPALVSSSSSSSQSSSLAQPVSSSSGIASSIFGSTYQPAVGTSIGLGFNSSSQPTVFTFGAYCGSGASSDSTPSQPSGFLLGASFGPGPPGNSAQTNSAGFTFGLSSCSGSANNSVPMMFGSTGSSSGSIFSFTPSLSTSTPTFTSATPSASQPGFGSSSRAFAFDNPDPMIIDDSLAVDLVQASTLMSQWPKPYLLFPTVAFGSPPEDSMAVDLVQASMTTLPPSTACFLFSTVASGCPAEDSMAVDSVQPPTPPQQVFGLSPMLQPSTIDFVCSDDDMLNADDRMVEDSVMTSTPGRLFGQSTTRFVSPTGESPFQFEVPQQCCERIPRTKWRRGWGGWG